VIAPLAEELPQVISHEEIRDEQSGDLENWLKKIVVPFSLRHRLLRLGEFPVIAGHPGVSNMYASMRRKFFWKEMYKDDEETVRLCTVWAKNRVTERKRTSFLKFFPADGPLRFVSMDILGPLPKTEHGNHSLLVISDRFSNLTRTVPLRTIFALVVAKAFGDAWVFSYGPPRTLLTDNGMQFNAKYYVGGLPRTRNRQEIYHCISPADKRTS
jgi:transposase InsO family protein